MAYAFNENIMSQNGTPGSVVTFNIAGFTVNAVADKDGVAKVNASPFYQALFADIDKNTNDTFTTEISGVKYGYCGIGESESMYSSQRSEYNSSSAIGKCQVLVRFLDHFGNWCYWLMERGSRGVTDSQGGETMTGVVDGEHAVKRPQMKSNAAQLVLCGKNVDETTWMFLCEIKKSIHVCVKESTSGSWIPVVVTSGQSTWVHDERRKKRQNFEITVVKPENTISL